MDDQMSIRAVLDTEPSVPSSTTDQPQEQLPVKEPNTSDDIVYSEGAQLAIVISSMIMTLFLQGLDLAIVAPAIPSLTNECHTIEDISWNSSPYSFVIATFGFFFGKLYTVYSVKHVYIASVAFFELGSLLCTVAPTSKAFDAGRAVAGFGACGVGSGGLTIVALCFPLQKRPLWTAVINASQSVGLVTAPVIGGALIDVLSWRAW